MNGLFLIKDSLAHKISYYHLMLLMASLPFDMFYSHLILVSYALHTLIHLKRDTIKPIFKLRTLILQSVFYVTVFSTIYTINRPAAFDEWGRHITILLFPVLFCLNPLDIRKYKSNLLLSFALVCVATILYLFADALLVIRHYGLPYRVLFSPNFTNHNFSEPIGMHATFLSLQMALALVYLLSVLIREKSNYGKLFYLACSGILTAGLIQLSSKTICLAVIACVVFALPYFMLQGVRRLRFMLVASSILILLVIGILNSGTFRERYVRELEIDLTKRPAGQTTDSRLARWDATIELIGKAPVIGYGAGSELGLLHDSFFNKKLYDSFLKGLNTHNEYLSVLLKYGIIGFLIYAGTLAWGFKKAWQRRDLLFFTFMTLIAVLSISENLLDVDKGVIFYAFFFSFFIFSNEQPAYSTISLEEHPAALGDEAEIGREKRLMTAEAAHF